MDKTDIRPRRAGFTLAELLLVVAILAVLAGLGATGLFTLERNIRIARYDGLAREVYAAAQNRLAGLTSNGMDGETAAVLQSAAALSQRPEDCAQADWSREEGQLRHAGRESPSVMEVLLPLGAAEENARSGGWYVIEYSVDPWAVYSVFYAGEAFDYEAAANLPGFRLSRDIRRSRMVGYYGGGTVARDRLEVCETPRLEIVNGNELRLILRNMPEDGTVSVEVSDGENRMDASGMIRSGVELPDPDLSAGTVLLDGMKSGTHFYERFPELTPGRDLTVTVTYEKPGRLSASASETVNSLFATRESQQTQGDTVTVAWARHLQNLEYTVSRLNDSGIAAVRQTEHIQWDWAEMGDFPSIRNRNANENLKRYDGSGLEIRDLSGANGLFAETGEGMGLNGIRIVNPVIRGGGGTGVGALVGEAGGGTQIQNCAVYSGKLAADGTVDYAAFDLCYVNGGTAVTGGLVGTAADAVISGCFAALPSVAGQGGALIGRAEGCRITNSYAVCDRLPEGAYFLIGGTGSTITHCYAAGNRPGETTGRFAPENNAVTDCYYAISHRGEAGALAVTEFCYAGTDGRWRGTDRAGMQKAPLPGDWTAVTAPLSHPYRASLDGEAYPYPTIAGLDHYGSWPDSDGTVSLKITMELLGGAENAVFAGRVLAENPEELDENGNPTVLFDSRWYQSDTGTWNGADPTVQVAPGTDVTLRITPAEGYQYVHTQIADQKSGDSELTFPVKKDTEAVVRFRQTAFTLRGLPPVGEDGEKIGGYTLEPEDLQDICFVAEEPVQALVTAGSVVYLRPEVPEGCEASVVWCTAANRDEEADRIYLTPLEDGRFCFPMPDRDADVHLRYTPEKAFFQVEYYPMDPDGARCLEMTRLLEIGAGTRIDQTLVRELAERSGLLQTVQDEQVLYLAKAVATDRDGRTVFESELDENGGTVLAGVPCQTVPGASTRETPYTLRIEIDRKQYRVTLCAGENVQGVRFGTGGEAGDTVSGRFYYGAEVTAAAEAEGDVLWDPQVDQLGMAVGETYTFPVPAFDVTLKADSAPDRHLVTLRLLENGFPWRIDADSRQIDPVTLTLVDGDREYPMKPRGEGEVSYVVQAVVPPAEGSGYRIRVDYASGGVCWLLDPGEGHTSLILTVEETAVEADAEFFTVGYLPNKPRTAGAVPQGGTYPRYTAIEVAANPGLLRNVDGEDPEQVFSGWRERGGETLYAGGERICLTSPLELLAQWEPEALEEAPETNPTETQPDPRETDPPETQTIPAETAPTEAQPDSTEEPPEQPLTQPSGPADSPEEQPPEENREETENDLP